MAAERPLYKSQSEFARAKHLHKTDVAAAGQGPPPASPPRMREHPCTRAATGPELREWKFSSARYVDPREELGGGRLHSSQRDLSLRKSTHGHVIPPLDPTGGAPHRDPQEFRHKSQHELANEVKVNKTPLYPLHAISPQSRKQVSEPRSVRSGAEVRDGLVDASGRPATSQKRLAYEKTQHARSHCAAARAVTAAPPSGIVAAGSPTNAYYKRVERARALREASPEYYGYGDVPERHVSPSRRAHIQPSREGVGIDLIHGKNYPPVPDTVGPQGRDAEYFQHHSQAQMRDEKQISATPIHPPPKSPPPALGVDAPVASQQTFANQKRRHNRTHSHSPSASPARSPGAHPAMSPLARGSSHSPSPARSGHQPPPAPPRYVGIRPAGGPANLAAGRLSLSPSRSPEQTTA